MPDPASSRESAHAIEQRFRLLVESVRDYAIFMLDTEGRVQTWNTGAERFKGYRAEEIIGQHFSKFYPPDALAAGLPAHELAMAREVGSHEDEGWRVRKDGTRFWANVVITALRDPSGELVGFAKVTRDLTQRRNHEEALRLSEERFRLLVEGVDDHAIFMLDPNGMVASWNVGAERINGYTADEIIGRHFSTFYPREVVESGWPDHELAVAVEQGRFVDEGWRVRKDGSRFWANVTITALRDEDSRLIGFAKLTRDLTERRRAESVLEERAERDEMLDAERTARISAQRATRIKDEFLAVLSHELRTPLSAIVGWTQILRRQPSGMDPAQVQRAIEVIDRNARSQVQLINDLLDLSRVMTGKLRLDLQQVPLAEIVQQAVESARPAAVSKGIRLIALLDPNPVSVTADPARLQQVTWNLLTNAIKFTPKGGQIQVVLQRVNSHIELHVSDTGIGIQPSFLPNVFDRFSQQDSSTTRAHGGLGLGLAISKQIVELHGGSIRATSEGEGRGTTFTVHLPMAIAQFRNDGDERQHPTAESATIELLDLPLLKGVHVFVVDDEADTRDLVQLVLEQKEAVVSSFETADAALQALKQSRPDAIVCDIGMPRMDGYQFMRALRASERRHERIPAVALTAFARPEDRKRALLAGYQAHLAKPFDVAELMLLLADLIDR